MNKITNSLLIAILGFSLNSCSPKHEKIGYEVNVTKDNGTKLLYEDYNKDSVFDYVTIEKPNENPIKYHRSLLSDSLVKKLQKEFKTVLDINL